VRAVIGRPTHVRFRVEDDGGLLTAVDAATTVPVTVTDGSGANVSNGNAVADASVAGIYVYTFTPPTKLDVLTATATATVGGAPISLSQSIRLVDRRIAPLSVYRQDPNLNGLSLDDFLRAVDQAEDRVTEILAFSPVQTGDRFEFRVRDYTARLRLPGTYHPALPYSVSFNDQPFTSTALASIALRAHAYEYTSAYFTGGYDPVYGVWGSMFPPGVYNVWAPHGWTSAPQDLQTATVKLASHYGQTSLYPDRATRVMTEQSEMWFSTPDGDKRPTGIPEVDGVLTAYRIALPFADDSASF
jgi:hypothetical protein